MVAPTTASFREDSDDEESCLSVRKIFWSVLVVLCICGFVTVLVFGILSNEYDEDLDGPEMPGGVVPKSKQGLLTLELDELEDFHLGDEVDELPNFVGMDQADPDLIKYVQSEYLIRPASRYEPYSLRVPKQEYFIEPNLGVWVRRFFKDKRGLIFVDAGAQDGEVFSNTLALEMRLGWSGLLIDCSPKVTGDLVSKRRKAWLATVCISNNTKAQRVNLSIPTEPPYDTRLARTLPPWQYSRLGGHRHSNWTMKEGLEAVPLYTILKAVGIKEIDFLSLDVEGIEIEILINFPFHLIPIKVIIVDIYYYSEDEREVLKEFMKSKGYKFMQSMEIDYIFVLKSMLKNSSEL